MRVTPFHRGMLAHGGTGAVAPTGWHAFGAHAYGGSQAAPPTVWHARAWHTSKCGVRPQCAASPQNTLLALHSKSTQQALEHVPPLPLAWPLQALHAMLQYPIDGPPLAYWRSNFL